MYRFFVKREQICEGLVRIEGEDVNHIRNVLRMRPGERILVCCGDEWEYTCRIAGFADGAVRAEILDAQKPGKELPSRIMLLQCLPKGDKMELIIQKAVELGAAEIVPVASGRSVVKLDAKKAAAKVERWNAIAASAAKQSMRMVIPKVHPVLKFQEALEYAGKADVRLMPYEKAEGMEATRRRLSALRSGESVAVLIGPEGGFEDREAEEAAAQGFSAVSLGRRILRTETAGLTALSILMYLLEQD
jgi:16S rRNA (uracil1498-N3)-methyltransferase